MTTAQHAIRNGCTVLIITAKRLDIYHMKLISGKLYKHNAAERDEE